jgi:hypothetical protein
VGHGGVGEVDRWQISLGFREVKLQGKICTWIHDLVKFETPIGGKTVVIWISSHVDWKSCQEGLKKKRNHFGISGFGGW